jgi:2-methylcitrate dehydratase PrpD
MSRTDISIEGALIDWAAQLRFEDLPEGAVAQSKRLLLDTLAVAWAGAGAEGVDAVRRFVTDQGGRRDSCIWGREDRVPSPAAAWVNGLFASALDFDSVHDEATMHPDIVTVPALLALADVVPMSGRDFIAAHVAADELMVRLGLAAGKNPGWFLTSALGVFVSAAICARVLGLPIAGIRAAAGIALSRASGSQQTLIEGSFSKRLQSAYAARDGVEAALLARVGVTGPLNALTGTAGFASLYTTLDADRALSRLGETYRFISLTVKQYPSCFGNHAAIIAALELIRLHDLPADLIESGTVVLTPPAARLVGGPFRPGDNPQLAAQFSVQYSVANVFHRGGLGIDDIKPEAVRDPAILALASRFEVQIDSTLIGKFTPATVVVRLRDGSERRAAAHSIPGTPEAPLSDAQIVSKARVCFASGPNPLDEQRAAALLSRIDKLESIDSMSDICSF